MKRIDLPITRCFSTRSVDLCEADLTKPVFLGEIDAAEFTKELDQARGNGGLVIWSAICLEKKLESIISTYIFREFLGNIDFKGYSFFQENIMASDILSFSAKRKLVLNIIDLEAILRNEERNELERILSRVIKYRNAFAHGDIEFQADSGCILKYYSNGHRIEQLSDEYWQELEEAFSKADSMLCRVYKSIHEHPQV